MHKSTLTTLNSALLGTKLLYILCTDLEGNYTFANEHYCQRFDCALSELLGKNSMDNILPADRQKCLDTVQACLEHPGQSFFVQLRKFAPEASTPITNHWEFKAIRHANGQPAEVLCIGVDVTGQKLQEQEVLYKSRLLDTIGQPAIAIDLNGTVEYWNQAAATIYGYTKEEMLGRNIELTLHQPDYQQIAEAAEALRQGKNWSGEQWHRTKNGRIFPAYVVDSPITDEKGQTTGAVATAQDISKQKAFEEHLLKITNNVPGAVYQMRLDSDGNITFPFVSNGIKELQAELTPQILKKDGSRAFDYILPEDVPIVQQVIAQAVEGDLSEISVEYRVYTGEDGQLQWNRATAKPEIESDGAIVWYGVFENIDQEKQAQEERNCLLDKTTEQNQRLKDFSFMLSHNIRSSTANLQGLTQMLREEPHNSEYLNLLEKTVDNLNRTLSNVNELLNFENNINLQERAPCPILESVERVLELNARSIQEQGIQFSLKVPPGLSVNAIPAYLDSIIHNLISNAIKYGTTDLQKTIEIRASERQGQTYIEVQDWGAGIDLKKHHSRMFKLGSRLQNEQEGQGLGLFMTKHQVEVLGGSIEVESEPGKGTTFTLRFPQPA